VAVLKKRDDGIRSRLAEQRRQEHEHVTKPIAERP
jgi:hypothetical protein